MPGRESQERQRPIVPDTGAGDSSAALFADSTPNATTSTENTSSRDTNTVGSKEQQEDLQKKVQENPEVKAAYEQMKNAGQGGAGFQAANNYYKVYREALKVEEQKLQEASGTSGTRPSTSQQEEIDRRIKSDPEVIAANKELTQAYKERGRNKEGRPARCSTT
jgi:hypothetical protein